MILVIDNYDSFVYNLARYFQRLGQETHVVRNDALSVAEIRASSPAAIVISPGPCTPLEAGCSLEAIRQLWREVPMLGVCLGHQALAAAFGGRIVPAPQPMHGRTSRIHHTGEGLFEHVPNPLTVCRYHSLVADPASLPEPLAVTAHSDDGAIMAVQHQSAPLAGVQFHPEAILTECGYQLLANFLRLAGLSCPRQLPARDEELVESAPAEPPIPLRPVTF